MNDKLSKEDVEKIHQYIKDGHVVINNGLTFEQKLKAMTESMAMAKDIHTGPANHTNSNFNYSPPIVPADTILKTAKTIYDYIIG